MYCNLNNVRIVHYQIFDVPKEAVVQTSILLHVHGSFKVFLESSKGGKCMLRSLQWHVQFIANLISQNAEHLSKARFCNKSLWKAGLPEILRNNNFYK